MRRIAWSSEKGGTAKTTSAVNVAVGLAKAGQRVLALDLDPQANLSMVFLNGREADPPTIGAVLLGDAEIAKAIRSTTTPGLDVIPSDVGLADVNLALANLVGRETRLRVALDEVQGYDVIVMDTPPTRSLLTINALTAADEVFIPVEPSLFSLSGLGRLQAAIADVRRFLGNPGLRIGGILLTRTRNDSVSRDVAAHLREMFGELVFESSIPQSVKVEEAHGRFLGVLDYSPRSAGALAYQALVTEILNRGKAKRTGRLASRIDATDDGRRAG